MSYISITPTDRQEMLKAIGLENGTVDDLFKIIPPELRAKPLNIPNGKSEFEVKRTIGAMAKRNATDLVNFLGGGFYDHYIPSAVNALTSRSEFYTAYTPYQPEAAQGTLQAIYEFQSCICRLTGMDAANASLYDGGTAIFEAIMMAKSINRRQKVVVDGGVNPIYLKMLKSYCINLKIDLVTIPVEHGQANREEIFKHLDKNTTAVVVQNPNFFGCVDDFSDIVEECHKQRIVVIGAVYPISLGLLKTPAEMGIDIVVGEGQSLGMPLSFGGPYLGFIATTKKNMRRLPGRICGATTDKDGKQSFVLTLQTREQHIRREKASSNICSNQALCALRAVIYMSLIGNDGIKELAQQNLDKSEYAKLRLSEVRGVEVMTISPTFNEFVIKLPKDPSMIVGKLIERGIAAGFPLGRYYKSMKEYLLISVTEKRTKQEIGRFAEVLEEVLWN